MNDEQRAFEVLDGFLGRVRRDVEAHLRTLTADLLGTMAGNSMASRPDLERLVADLARPAANRIDRSDILNHLLDGVRRLDDATTLRAILEALAEGAAAEATRVAVMLVDGDTLKSWRQFGFAPGKGPVDLLVAASSLLSGTVTLRQATSVPPTGTTPDPSMPQFLRVPAGHVGLLIPLVVGGHVVAVLFAAGADRKPNDATAPGWTQFIEVLVRHASSRLENVTSLRTVEFLTKPA